MNPKQSQELVSRTALEIARRIGIRSGCRITVRQARRICRQAGARVTTIDHPCMAKTPCCYLTEGWIWIASWLTESERVSMILHGLAHHLARRTDPGIDDDTEERIAREVERLHAVSGGADFGQSEEFRARCRRPDRSRPFELQICSGLRT